MNHHNKKDKNDIYSGYHHFHNVKPAPTTRAAAERFAVEFLALCNKHLSAITEEKIRM